MAVIINELEVVMETPPEVEATADTVGTAPGGQSPMPQLTPLDISDVTQRQARIELRVWAH